MKRIARIAPLLLLVLALLPMVASSQAPASVKPMPTALVAIYHVAPGQHLEFLKWMAAGEAIDKEAGVPPTVFYAHTEGDSWDYMAISPDLSQEQQDKVDQVSRARGRKVGFASSLEFRTFVTSHTDTSAYGPVSAADLVAAAGK